MGVLECSDRRACEQVHPSGHAHAEQLLADHVQYVQVEPKPERARGEPGDAKEACHVLCAPRECVHGPPVFREVQYVELVWRFPDVKMAHACFQNFSIPAVAGMELRIYLPKVTIFEKFRRPLPSIQIH